MAPRMMSEHPHSTRRVETLSGVPYKAGELPAPSIRSVCFSTPQPIPPKLYRKAIPMGTTASVCKQAVVFVVRIVVTAQRRSKE